MKRLLVGMTAAGMLLLGLTPAASAAEIPPTAECQATFKTLFRDYVRVNGGKSLSSREEKKLNRQLTYDIEAAGCISNAAELFRKDPSDPKSPQCAAGAKTAAAMWKVDGKKINTLYRNEWRRTKAALDRAMRIEKRMLALTRKGGHERQVKRLQSKVDAIYSGFARRGLITQRKATRIVGDHAAANVLTYLELASLGCVDLDYSSDDKPAGPADRVVKNQMGLILSSYLRIAQSAQVDSQGSKSTVLSALLPVAGK